MFLMTLVSHSSPHAEEDGAADQRELDHEGVKHGGAHLDKKVYSWGGLLI